MLNGKLTEKVVFKHSAQILWPASTCPHHMLALMFPNVQAGGIG